MLCLTWKQFCGVISLYLKRKKVLALVIALGTFGVNPIAALGEGPTSPADATGTFKFVTELETWIFDDATDGCWTNMQEIKEYMSAKMSNADIRAVERSPVKFSVTVFSERNDANRCYGSAEGEIVYVDGRGFQKPLSKTRRIFTGQEDANYIAFGIVDDIIADVLDDLRSYPR